MAWDALEYSRRPEVKARRKAYRQRPEVKARIRKYKRDFINASPNNFVRAKVLNQRLQAKRKKMDWELDVDTTVIEILKQGECELSGKKFIYEQGTKENKNLLSPSIDRIDSDKFYTQKNKQYVCWAINKMKQDLPQDVFIEYCTLVAKKAGRI